MFLLDLKRKEGESNVSYQRRLVYGKLIDKTLADVDYTELGQMLYGQAYAPDVARRMVYGSRRTLEALDADEENDNDDADSIAALEEKKTEIAKERQKLFDQRAALNRIIRERSRQEELNEIITEAVSNGGLPTLYYHPALVKDSDNDLLVSLNDIHYGANVSNHWNVYNSDVCATMMCRYLDKVNSIREVHDSENCIVWQNGDAISGNIHKSISVTNKENVVEQVIGVSELIADFLAGLSSLFGNVTYVSVAGNHSRITPNKDEAVSGERLDNLIEWYLKARLQNFENVHIGGGNKIDESMYVMDIRGKTYLGVHGDFDSGNDKVRALLSMAGKNVYAVLSGHMHHNKIDEVLGVKTVMAGSFLGMDSYCVEKRIIGKPEQLVCVCDDNGIRCSYDVLL